MRHGCLRAALRAPLRLWAPPRPHAGPGVTDPCLQPSAPPPVPRPAARRAVGVTAFCLAFALALLVLSPAPPPPTERYVRPVGAGPLSAWGYPRHGPAAVPASALDASRAPSGRRGPGRPGARPKASNVAARKPPGRARATPGGGGPGGAAREGVRINHCCRGLSRRGADAAVAAGRVTINGRVAVPGDRVMPGDVVRLDQRVQDWQDIAHAKQVAPSRVSTDGRFVYLKYWKPRGVTSTSDPSDPTNIIKAGAFNMFPQRLFTVGRLDKDSTGLILLTSDGRVNNAMLRPSLKKEKIYEVKLDKVPSEADLERLRRGVVITTAVQRDRVTRDVTAKTLPCGIRRLGGRASPRIEFTLTEGRNRQIRRMCEALGYTVVDLHRVSFAGISIKGLRPNTWAQLEDDELAIIQNALTDYHAD